MRRTNFCLFVLFALGSISGKPLAAAGVPVFPTAAAPPLTTTDVVGLWQGNVRVLGHTDLWQFLPKFIHYDKNGTSVTISLNNTVLFQKDGTFLVTTEGDTDTRDTLQYRGRYSVKDAILTMTFGNAHPGADQVTANSFSYTLSHWNDDLQLNDPKQAGFQSLLSPLTADWQPRKGSLVYQAPSGPMQLEMDGQLNQSYHYLENGVTHYAHVDASWRLVRPNGPHDEPLICLDGVRDGADFETVTLPLQAVPGLPAAVKEIQASTTVPGYFYTLELTEVAETDPKQYVWSVHFDYQSGWETEKGRVPPQTFYSSLISPDLRQLIGRLPSGTLLTYTPRWRMSLPTRRGFLSAGTEPPLGPEYGLKDFASFCKSKNVQFHLNYNRF